MKKALALLLSMIMLISVFPFAAIAEDEEPAADPNPVVSDHDHASDPEEQHEHVHTEHTHEEEKPQADTPEVPSSEPEKTDDPVLAEEPLKAEQEPEKTGDPAPEGEPLKTEQETASEESGKKGTGDPEAPSEEPENPVNTSGEEPKETVCEHANTAEKTETRVVYKELEDDDRDTDHVAETYSHIVVYCLDCGETVTSGAETLTGSIREKHVYDSNAKCEKCEHECEHLNRTQGNRMTGEPAYTPIDANDHSVTGSGETYWTCSDCGKEIDVQPVDELTFTEAHTLNDGICGKCGFTLTREPDDPADPETCTHENAYRTSVIYDYEHAEYDQEDNQYHVVSGLGYYFVYCPDCGMEIAREDDQIISEQLTHSYEDGICQLCGYECYHPSTIGDEIVIGDVTYEDYGNDDMHYVSGNRNYGMICQVCGKRIETKTEYETWIEPHAYENNICTICGHEKNTCEHLHRYSTTMFVDEVEYSQYDEYEHLATGLGYYCTFCSDCGNFLSYDSPETMITKTECHVWNEAGVCECCLYENHCEHLNTFPSYSFTDWEHVVFTPYNKQYHEVTGSGYHFNRCEDCGMAIDKEPETTITVKEWHVFDDNGICEYCSYEDTCEHLNTWRWYSFTDEVEYEPIDSRYHQVTGQGYYYTCCEDCGRQINKEPETIISETEWHQWDANGVCYQCQYENTCTHTSTDRWYSFTDIIEYTPIDNLYHTVSGKGYYYTYCIDCGKTLNEEPETSLAKEETHYYDSDGVCRQCGHVNTCSHPNTYRRWSFYGDAEYEPVDNRYHRVTGLGVYYTICSDCEMTLSQELDTTISELEWHDFDSNNICTVCGFELNCQHINTWLYNEFIEGTALKYTSISNEWHRVSGRGHYYTYCNDCNRIIDIEPETTITYDEQHDYDANGVCTLCNHVNTCQHENTGRWYDFTDWDQIEYAPVNNQYHQATGRGHYYTYCIDCGITLDEEPETTITWDFSHDYSNGVCHTCGHTNTCNHAHTETNVWFYSVPTPTFTYYDIYYHEMFGKIYELTTCLECGMDLNRSATKFGTVMKPHYYDESGKCIRCGYKNNCVHANVSVKTYITDYNEAVYTELPGDDDDHEVTAPGYRYTVCDDCGLRLSQEDESTITFSEQHVYRNNVCVLCGHEDSHPIDHIEVVPPAKTDYTLYRDYFDPAGGLVSVFYTDGSQEDIDLTVDMISGFNHNISGIQVIKVTYKGYTDTFEITVGSPAVTKLTLKNDNGGVLISWPKVEGAQIYTISRKVGKGSWTTLGTSTELCYFDKKAASNKTYSYKVTAKLADGSTKSFTASVTYLAAPAVKLSNVTGGVKVSWAKVTGAVKYRVYKKQADGSWKKLSDVTTTSYTDKNCTSGNSYTYTVQCISKDGKKLTSGRNETGTSILYVARPTVKTASVTAEGVTLTWSAPAGSENYRVYRKTAKGSWTKVGETAELTFTDTTAKSGTAYSYAVSCISANGAAVVSAKSAAKSVTFVGAPVVKLTNVAGGVKVSWAKVTGAVKYRVYKIVDGELKKLSDVTTTSYTDKNCISADSYEYTVQCVSKDGKKLTSGKNDCVEIQYIAAPTVTAVKTADGVKVSWNAPAGSDYYRVYRKTTGSWTELKDTAELTYTDETAKSGTAYTYTVRCITPEGTNLSGMTSGKKVTYLMAPVVILSNASGGIKVSWGKIAGAVKYRVYKMVDGSWKKLADVTTTSYTDKTCKDGEVYEYTVCCVSKDGKSVTSAKRDGESLQYIAVTTVTAAMVPGGVKVSWKATEGAGGGYGVYRKTGSGNYELLDYTDELTYTDTTPVSGTTYTYSVRCVSTEGDSWSAYAAGKTVKYIAVPTITEITYTGTAVKVTWSKSAGAVKYRVFRKTEGEAWKKLTDTTSLTYSDKTAKSGVTYWYMVRCVTKDGKSYTSGIDNVGVQFTVE